MEFDKLTKADMVKRYNKLVVESTMLLKEYTELEKRNQDLFKMYQRNLAVIRKLKKLAEEE